MAPAAYHAAHRFGLGRRPGEPLPDDPRAWLRAQLDAPDPLAAATTEGTSAGLAAFREDRRDPRRDGPPRARVIYRAEAARQLGHAIVTAAPFRERLVRVADGFLDRRRRPSALTPETPLSQERERPLRNRRVRAKPPTKVT